MIPYRKIGFETTTCKVGLNVGEILLSYYSIFFNNFINIKKTKHI